MSTSSCFVHVRLRGRDGIEVEARGPHVATIRDGQLAEPVREFTIASTLQRMLLDIVEVGGDVDWLPMRAAGVTLVIDDVTMSGE